MAGRKVKCKLCKTELDKDQSYCIEKKSEKTGKITREYYCSEDEYMKDKEEKGLWRELLVLYDYCLGFTSISKIKVNQIKELEKVYSRREIYECLNLNREVIRKNLENKGIIDEYGMISYITSCIKNKIKDFSSGLNNTIEITSSEDFIPVDCLEETEEDIFKRLNKSNELKNKESIMDIIRRINKEDDN